MLSQWEIDSILGSLEGETDGGKSLPAGSRRAKLYDFRRPDKFSKENLRALRMVHETFCRVVGSSLSSYLRTGVQAQLSSVEQIVYDEYIQQLPHPTLVNIVNLNPLPGRVLIEINLDLGFVMLDRLLGGPGMGVTKARELTDIEYSLLRRLVGQILRGYRDAWGSITTLAPELDEIVLNPQFVQAALPGDMAVFILCELKLLEKSGTISICVPHTVLEPVMDRLSAQTWFTSTRRSGQTFSFNHADLQKQLRGVSLEVSAELGQATLTFRELMDLRVGDVIKLATGIDDELTMHVEAKPKYLCRPGLIGRNIGLQITRTLEETEVPFDAHEAKNPSAG